MVQLIYKGVDVSVVEKDNKFKLYLSSKFHNTYDTETQAIEMAKHTINLMKGEKE